MAKSKQYRVVVAQTSWIDEGNNVHFARPEDGPQDIPGDPSDPNTAAGRLLTLGQVRPWDEDEAALTTAAPEAPEDLQSEGEEALTPDRLAGMSVEQIRAWVDTHPEQRETVLAMEQGGRNRAGVAALGE